MLDIRNCDCLTMMKEYPDNYFDLCITSPPYNLGANHHTGNNRHSPYEDNLNEKEYQDNQILVLNELHRIMAQNASVFYNHKNRIKEGLTISPYEWIFKTNWKVKQELVWFNGGQNFDKIRFYPMTERIYWLSKNKDTKFFNHINHHDLFNWNAVGTKNKHKRAFPYELVTDLLRCFPRNLKVIEPYLGSGTVALACYDLGFDLTAAELDKDYYNLSLDRLQNHKNTLSSQFFKE